MTSVKRPQRFRAADWRGNEYMVENDQNGKAPPSTHSKRLKSKRKQGRR